MCTNNQQMKICWIHLQPRQQTFLILPNILVKLTGFPSPIYAFYQTNVYTKVPKFLWYQTESQGP